MKHLRVVAMLLCLCTTVLARGNSEPISTVTIGPEGGAFLSLVADNQNRGTFYAGAHHAGVFKTTNGAANWSYAGLTGFTVTALAIDANTSTLYALAGLEDSEGDFVNVKLFKSNEEKRWTPATSGLPSECYPGALVVDPQHSGTLYVSACGSVFKSTDAGETWSLASKGLPGLFAEYLALAPQDPSIIYAVTNQCDQSGKVPPPGCDSRIFKSTDAGENWSEATSTPLTGDLGGPLVIDPRDSNTLYLHVTWSPGRNGVSKSIDGGRTWTKPTAYVSPGFAKTALAMDPQDPSTIYASSLGVFKSTDGAQTWTAIYQPPVGFAALVVDPLTSGTIFGAVSDGIIKSTDGGASWSMANSGLRAIPALSMTIDPQSPDTLYAGTDYLGVFKSTDRGTSWASTSVPYGSSIAALAIDPQTPSNLYAGTEGDECAGVLKSVDAGTSWANTGLVNCISAVVIDPQNPSTVYAATLFRGILKSLDGAGSWTEINSGLPGEYVTALTLDPHDPQTLYAGVQSPAGLPGVSSTLLKSTDGGMSWNATGLTITRSVISTVALDPQNPSTLYAVTAIYPDAAGTLWKSVDGGTNWRDLSASLPSSVYVIGVNSKNPATIYAGTDVGVMTSTDAGESWQPLTPNIGPTHFLAFDPKNSKMLYAGGPGGLFEIAPSTITAVAFDVTVVRVGASYTATIAGSNLSNDMYFDVQARAPGSAADIVALNWQTGTSANHSVPAGTTTGAWTITGVRAHQIEADHTASFIPVSAMITVSP